MASASPKKSTTLAPLTYGGHEVRVKGEMISLTDCWKAAGSPTGRAPSDWLALVSTKEFVSAVEATLNAGIPGIKTRRGRENGGTDGHWQIGLAYAKYLSPDFHMLCNTYVRERMEGHGNSSAPSIADDKRAMSAIGNMIKNCTGVTLRDTMPALADAVVQRLPSTPKSTVVALADYRPASKPSAGIADLIAAHRTLVYIDEAMFDQDGQPKGDGHLASGQAERFAFRALMEAPCQDQADVTAKVAYLLNGTIGNRDSLLDGLLGLLDEDSAPIIATESVLMLFLRSLMGPENGGTSI